MKTHLPDIENEAGILSSINYLKFRIEDLNRRMLELDSGDYGPIENRYYQDVRYSKEELAVLPTELFFTPSDIERAIVMAYIELSTIIPEDSEKEYLNSFNRKTHDKEMAHSSHGRVHVA